MSRSKYIHHFYAIYADASRTPRRQLCAAILNEHNYSITLDAFYRLYKKWKHDKYGPAQKIKNGLHDAVQSTDDVVTDFAFMANDINPELNPFGIPASLEKDYKAFKLPVSHNNILFLNDIHIPYHNIPALTLALKYGVANNVNTIYLNGDIIDFYAISRFEKDPRKRDFAHEVMLTRDFLKALRNVFPNAAIYYKCGNHDARYEQYIMRNAPDLLGMDEFNLESLLHLAKYNIQYIPSLQITHIGKLTALHGHEMMTSVFSPVNIARGLFLRAKDSAICGHHHQASEHSEPNINGKVVTCWSVACLCELHPDYMPLNKHHHGFAHIITDKNGDFEVFNKRIVNGKIR